MKASNSVTFRPNLQQDKYKANILCIKHRQLVSKTHCVQGNNAEDKLQQSYFVLYPASLTLREIPCSKSVAVEWPGGGTTAHILLLSYIASYMHTLQQKAELFTKYSCSDTSDKKLIVLWRAQIFPGMSPLYCLMYFFLWLCTVPVISRISSVKLA